MFSYMVLYVTLRNVQEIRNFVFGISINEYYPNGLYSTADWSYEKKGLNNRTYMFLLSKVLSSSIYVSSM